MKPNVRVANAQADADVRRALAEYRAAQNQVRELNRDEPDADDPIEIHAGFDRLAKATARADQMARDALSNAVASFAGSAPCAVIVDSAGVSSVVALSVR